MSSLKRSEPAVVSDLQYRNDILAFLNELKNIKEIIDVEGEDALGDDYLLKISKKYQKIEELSQHRESFFTADEFIQPIAPYISQLHIDILAQLKPLFIQKGIIENSSDSIFAALKTICIVSLDKQARTDLAYWNDSVLYTVKKNLKTELKKFNHRHAENTEDPWVAVKSNGLMYALQAISKQNQAIKTLYEKKNCDQETVKQQMAKTHEILEALRLNLTHHNGITSEHRSGIRALFNRIYAGIIKTLNIRPKSERTIAAIQSNLPATSSSPERLFNNWIEMDSAFAPIKAKSYPGDKVFNTLSYQELIQEIGALVLRWKAGKIGDNTLIKESAKIAKQAKIVEVKDSPQSTGKLQKDHGEAYKDSMRDEAVDDFMLEADQPLFVLGKILYDHFKEKTQDKQEIIKDLIKHTDNKPIQPKVSRVFTKFFTQFDELKNKKISESTLVKEAQVSKLGEDEIGDFNRNKKA